MKALSPRQVRELVLADHAALRVRLELVRWAIRQADADADASALLDALPTLLDHLSAHLALEDQVLAPTLARIDAWGPEREKHLTREHTEQREWIERMRQSLVEHRDDVGRISTQAMVMIGRIEDDMRHEEASVLDPRLLTDDIVQVDFGG